MSPDDYQDELESRNQRSKKPAVYHDDILTWLKQYPEMTASQVNDCYAIVTSEYKESSEKIIEMYRGLWKIG